ncbi:hypothetical protein F444_11637 [Phytophthora nicotianae P1976]|uniref:Transposase IS30-like HTH domain-containing protein n=1 Tax=Phytophthora nicotianae P1976 TaxID=1317066 RepID=A0A080ZZT8_PHYNI|nr:hypothetical protein F444_11637 [Phytophthora nicotianae P1976]
MPRAKKPLPTLKKPRLTEHERGRIQGLHEAGVSARDIALLTDRSRDITIQISSDCNGVTWVWRTHGVNSGLST